MIGKSQIPIKDVLALGAKASVQGAENANALIASRSRATNVGERSLDQPDAGVMALEIIFTEIVNQV